MDGCASGQRRAYGDAAADSAEHAIDALTTTNSYEFEILAAAPVWAALMQWWKAGRSCLKSDTCPISLEVAPSLMAIALKVRS